MKSFQISRPYVHLVGKSAVLLLTLLVIHTFQVKGAYTGLHEVEDSVEGASYERLRSEICHPREAQSKAYIKPDEEPRPKLEFDRPSERTVKSFTREPFKTKLINVFKYLRRPFRYLYDKITKRETRWPRNKNTHSDDQKGLYTLEDEASIKRSDKPRGLLMRRISRTFELWMYSFRKIFPGLGRKIKHEPEITASEEDLRFLDGETFLGENASLMSKIEKTHGKLKQKFDILIHGEKAEAAKTITELIEELRRPSDPSAAHGYIIQFMREYTLYPSSDIDLLGHLALCLASLSSDKLSHITGLHERVIKYTSMNLRRKVIDEISKSPEIVDPLIKGMFFPREYILKVTPKELYSSTSLFAPKSHQLITLDGEVLYKISPEVEGRSKEISILLEASKRAVKLLEEDQSLVEVEQSSLLVYLYILEEQFKSIRKYPVLTQPDQKDGSWHNNQFGVFPKELKIDLKNMSASAHKYIVDKLSLSS